MIGKALSSMLPAAALLAACTSTEQPGYTGDPAVGYNVAQELCSSCHAINIVGASPNVGAPPLRCVLAWYDPDRLVADLDQAVSISHLRMPTFYFGDRHPADIVAYLKTIQTPARPQSVHASPTRPLDDIGGECAGYARRSGRLTVVD